MIKNNFKNFKYLHNKQEKFALEAVVMNYGVAYYPEHWGEDRIEEDAILMKQAHFNVVRMAEFAWTRIQPSEHTFNFEWLDKAIEIFANHGIKTVLGTPTACPPKYLMDRYPDIYTYDFQGIKRCFGSRRHYCFNSHNYLMAAQIITCAMANHYKDNENIIAWQIDNELGGDQNTLCFCDNCKKAFQAWLKVKYEKISNLNREWGTEVWSQLYSNFEEIEPPKYTHTVKNPSACLDYKRFCSNSAVIAQRMQIEIIKNVNTSWNVTTNTFGVEASIDYHELSKDTDFISWDDYPNLTLEKITPYSHAMGLDAMRGCKNKSFWSMETQTGTPGGDILFQTPRPGDMKRWVMQTIARGAQSILYFRWRTNFMGAEQYWHGILNHDGIPRRLYNEARQIGEDLIKINNYVNFEVKKSSAALVYSQEISWAFQIQPLIVGYNYYEHVKEYYKAAFDNNFQLDIISPNDDFTGYKILILPNFLFCIPEWSKKIEAFVQKGGTIIMDFRSGVKDSNNKVIIKTLPCDFVDVLGFEIEEYGIILNEEKVFIKSEKFNGSAKKWYDMIVPATAKTLAYYDCNDYYNNYPAILLNHYQKGKSYYISSSLNDELLYSFLKYVFNEEGIYPVIETPIGVEAIQKNSDSGDLIFIINHDEKEQLINLKREYEDLLTSQTRNGEIVLQSKNIVILKI